MEQLRREIHIRLLPCKWFLLRLILLCWRWNGGLLGREGVSDGEELALWQDRKEEAQSLQENLGRHLTLLHQLRRKRQILRSTTGSRARARPDSLGSGYKTTQLIQTWSQFVSSCVSLVCSFRSSTA